MLIFCYSHHPQMVVSAVACRTIKFSNRRMSSLSYGVCFHYSVCSGYVLSSISLRSEYLWVLEDWHNQEKFQNRLWKSNGVQSCSLLRYVLDTRTRRPRYTCAQAKEDVKHMEQCARRNWCVVRFVRIEGRDVARWAARKGSWVACGEIYHVLYVSTRHV